MRNEMMVSSLLGSVENGTFALQLLASQSTTFVALCNFCSCNLHAYGHAFFQTCREGYPFRINIFSATLRTCCCCIYHLQSHQQSQHHHTQPFVNHSLPSSLPHQLFSQNLRQIQTLWSQSIL